MFWIRGWILLETMLHDIFYLMFGDKVFKVGAKLLGGFTLEDVFRHVGIIGTSTLITYVLCDL